MTKIILFSLLILISFSAEAQKRCKIVGKIIDRPQSTTLLLAESGEDLRIQRIEIPIENGEFKYEFEYSNNVEYSLSFNEEVQNGSWRSIPFFPKEKGIIKFVLYPKEKYDCNIVKGDPEKKNRDNYTKVRGKFMATLNSIYAEMDKIGYLNEEGGILDKKIENELNETIKDSLLKIFYKGINDSTLFSEKYIEYTRKANEVVKDIYKCNLEHISKYPSLHCYSSLETFYAYRNGLVDMKTCDDIFHNIYEKRYPDHLYTKKIRTAMAAQDIKVGGKFIDFEAPDANGNIYKLSTLIAGKIAIINLWASW